MDVNKCLVHDLPEIYRDAGFKKPFCSECIANIKSARDYLAEQEGRRKEPKEGDYEWCQKNGGCSLTYDDVTSRYQCRTCNRYHP